MLSFAALPSAGSCPRPASPPRPMSAQRLRRARETEPKAGGGVATAMRRAAPPLVAVGLSWWCAAPAAADRVDGMRAQPLALERAQLDVRFSDGSIHATAR